MSVSISDALIVTTVSFYTQSSPSSTPTAPEFSCDSYAVMLDIEIRLARECTTNTNCEQVLFEDELECEANSIVGSTTFDSNYLYDLYDEATFMGCMVELPINNNCTHDELACISGTCAWN